MAAIDKIYVHSWDEYIQFKDWCMNQPEIKDKYGRSCKITDFLYKYKEPFENEHPIFRAPYYIDAYLIKNCPFDFIQKELMINYGHHTQEWIDEAYKTVMERGGNKSEPGEIYYWLSKDDFKIVDGVVTMPNEEPSDYELIRQGQLYDKPTTSAKYNIGMHFKCVKHPYHLFNTAYKCKYWFVDIKLPDGMGFMWYHKDHNSWDFADEFVNSDGASSTCVQFKTIKAIKRAMRKWKLPIGTIVKCTGRYMADTYEFKIIS